MACPSIVVKLRAHVTFPAPIATPPPPATRALPALIAAIACALLLGLSVFPPSSTRIQVWPWAGFAAAGWLLPIVIALFRIGRNLPHARLGGLLDAGLSLLAVTATLSAFVSPLRGVVLPHLLPVLGMCALPFALLPAIQPSCATKTWRISGWLLALILGISLLLWLDPWHGFAGIRTRNDQPFGHANITGSVAVLAATWLAAGAVRETGRARVLFILGSALGVVTAASSESRGAVLALAAAGAVAAAITLLQRGRFWVSALLFVVLAAGTVASNARLRELVIHGHWSMDARESNDQRTAMLIGGLRLGAERPLLGWGAGAVPHVFPRVRADLPGTADNVLQLHNSPTQLWATLGSAGLLAVLLIAAGLVARLRGAPWTPERTALAAGLAATVVVLLFDHPFATPVFAVLAAAHLAAWATSAKAEATSNLIGYSLPRMLATGVGTLLLIFALTGTLRDLAARSAFADALDHAAVNDPDGYRTSLQHAADIAPDDPYYAHVLAAHLVTGHPFPDARPTSPQAAIPLLERTLVANPDLEYAHYNLGWLLLGSDPAAAAQHFLSAAHLAPQRGGVYLGLGVARIQLHDTDGAVRAFAAEWLLDPTIAWSPLWTQPPLDALRSRIHALANQTAQAHRTNDPWAELDAPATPDAPYRRLRTGYGVLMGHPDGPPPVDFNIQQKMLLPLDLRARIPSFGWIPGQELLHVISAP